MNDWDKLADESAEATDEKLSKGLEKLVKADLGALCPNPEEREKVAQLVAAVQAQTDKNERIAAFKAVASVVGERIVNIAKTAMLGIIIALSVSTANAQVSSLDLSNPLADPRAGFAWDGKGGTLGVAYVPVVYWVGEHSGMEYATLNWGMSDVLSDGTKKMMVSVGPRVDNAFLWLAGGKWAKKHLRFAMLPPVQVSVAILTSDFKHFRPWLALVTKFGSK